MSTRTPQNTGRRLVDDLQRAKLDIWLALDLFSVKSSQEEEIARAKRQSAPAAGSTVATGATVDQASSSSGDKPMTPSERARAGGLARWGKYKGKKKKAGGGGGAKEKKSPDQVDAERRAEALKKRGEVMAEFGEMGSDLLRGLEALASGKNAEEDDADELIKAGLAERVGADGTLVLTANGRKLYNVAGSGDVGMAREVLARAKDGVEKSAAAAAEKQKADEEKAKAAEEEKKGGGGGGGGKDDAAKEQEAAAKEQEKLDQAAAKQQEKEQAAAAKEQEKQDQAKQKKADQQAATKQRRSDALAAFGDEGVSMLDALDQLAAGGELDDEQAITMLMAGLVEPVGPDGTLVLSAAGKQLDKAATAGNAGNAREIIARAKADAYAKIMAAHTAAEQENASDDENASTAATKHMPGGHDQRSHGRSTARRAAYRAAYSAARAGGASVAEARTAARDVSTAIANKQRMANIERELAGKVSDRQRSSLEAEHARLKQDAADRVSRASKLAPEAADVAHNHNPNATNKGRSGKLNQLDEQHSYMTEQRRIAANKVDQAQRLSLIHI